MMNKTHAMSGIAAFVAVSPFLRVDAPSLVLGSIVCAASATLPDLDHSQSKPARIVFGPLRTRLSRVFVRHRGPTHTLAAFVAVSAACGFLAALVGYAPWWTVAVPLGYLAHLLGDALTVGNPREPMYLAWPVKIPSRGFFAAGKGFERRVAFPSLVAFTLWALVGYPGVG